MTDGAAGRKSTIFLAEDNSGDVELLKMALKTAGVECELIVVIDGREALEFVRQQGKYANHAPPDLAVLDLNLPKNDGLEVLEALRGNAAFSGVPVAIVSSSSAPQELARMQSLRVDRFIPKPADLDQYLKIGATLKDLLRTT
jgi:two-component system, chemotaxis family, response regulator Rcp1